MLITSTMSTAAEIAACAAYAGLVSGLKARPIWRSSARALEDDGAQIRAGLVVDGDAVTAGPLDRSEVLLRRLRHQVAVDERPAVVDDRRDPLQDDRADRDRLDEVAVADVEVKDAHARAEQHLDLLAEPREVGRVERGLHLHRSDPVVPAHALRV